MQETSECANQLCIHDSATLLWGMFGDETPSSTKNSDTDKWGLLGM